jgi:hypothetical protein
MQSERLRRAKGIAATIAKLPDRFYHHQEKRRSSSLLEQFPDVTLRVQGTLSFSHED